MNSKQFKTSFSRYSVKTVIAAIKNNKVTVVVSENNNDKKVKRYDIMINAIPIGKDVEVYDRLVIKTNLDQVVTSIFGLSDPENQRSTDPTKVNDKTGVFGPLKLCFNAEPKELYELFDLFHNKFWIPTWTKILASKEKDTYTIKNINSAINGKLKEGDKPYISLDIDFTPFGKKEKKDNLPFFAPQKAIKNKNGEIEIVPTTTVKLPNGKVVPLTSFNACHLIPVGSEFRNMEIYMEATQSSSGGISWKGKIRECVIKTGKPRGNKRLEELNNAVKNRTDLLEDEDEEKTVKTETGKTLVKEGVGKEEMNKLLSDEDQVDDEGDDL